MGVISSVAEFTPKNVETPDLRTALGYEVRIIVDDPDNRLRLGAPATVTIPLDPVSYTHLRQPAAGQNPGAERHYRQIGNKTEPDGKIHVAP